MHFKNNFNTGLIILIFLLVIFSKLLFLDSDTISIVNLHNEDESTYLHNIRNYIVEGVFVKDDTNISILTPVHSLTTYIFAKIMGMSIFSFRFNNAFFSFVTVILIFFGFMRIKQKKVALICLFLVSTDFLINVHSRIAMPEAMVTFFFTFAMYLFFSGELKNKKIYYIITGLICGLGFLVKSNATIMLGVIAIFLFLKTAYNYKKTNIQNIYPQARELLLKYLYLFLGATVPVTLWYLFIFKPNYKYISLAYSALITLHKPQIRGQLMDPIFLRNEFKEFIIGGEGNIWIYLSPYFLAILVGIFYAIKKRTKFNEIFWFNILWFLIGNIYFYILWYKPARWYTPNIIPLIIVTVFLLFEIPKKMRACLVTFILVFNLFLNFKYIYYKPTYYLKNASIEIEKIVGNNTYVGDSLVLMENKQSRAYNVYYLQNVYTTKTFYDFLVEKNYPAYLVIGKNQYNFEINKTNKYKYLNTVYSSNLQDHRPLSVYKLK